MRGGEQHAVAALLRPLVMLEAFVADPFATFALVMRGKRAKATSSRPMDAKTPSMVCASPGGVAIRIGERQIAFGDAAQTRNRRDRAAARSLRPASRPRGRGEYSSDADQHARQSRFQSVAEAPTASANLFDPAAADDEVTRIEHGRLPRRYGSLRFIETRFGARFRKADKASPTPGMCRLRMRTRTRAGAVKPAPGEPADIARDQSRRAADRRSIRPSPSAICASVAIT